MNDDEDLSAVLRSHIELLGNHSDDGIARNARAPTTPVLDAEGKVAIVDLMLSCRMPTATDAERRHLVVELKRPSQKHNEDVINQIKKYAKAVALDDRFRHSNVEWDFVAVANSFTKDAEFEARQKDKPRGLVLEIDDPIKVRVWAKTWGEIIQEAEGRLTLYKLESDRPQTDDSSSFARTCCTIKGHYCSEATLVPYWVPLMPRKELLR